MSKKSGERYSSFAMTQLFESQTNVHLRNINDTVTMWCLVIFITWQWLWIKTWIKCTFPYYVHTCCSIMKFGYSKKICMNIEHIENNTIYQQIYYHYYDNKKEWIYSFAITFSPFNTFRIDVLCSQINTLSVKRRDAFKIFRILTTCSCILHRWIEKSYFSPKLKCYLHFICYLPVCVNHSRSRLENTKL